MSGCLSLPSEAPGSASWRGVWAARSSHWLPPGLGLSRVGCRSHGSPQLWVPEPSRPWGWLEGRCKVTWLGWALGTLPPPFQGIPLGKLRPAAVRAVEPGTRAPCMCVRRGGAGTVGASRWIFGCAARAHHAPRSAGVPGSGSWRGARPSIRADSSSRRAGGGSGSGWPCGVGGGGPQPALHAAHPAPRGPGRGRPQPPVPGLRGNWLETR